MVIDQTICKFKFLITEQLEVFVKLVAKPLIEPFIKSLITNS